MTKGPGDKVDFQTYTKPRTKLIFPRISKYVMTEFVMSRNYHVKLLSHGARVCHQVASGIWAVTYRPTNF